MADRNEERRPYAEVYGGPGRGQARPPQTSRRGEFGGPYGRGYAENSRQRDRYGYADQRKRYGRRGDFGGYSEPGYDADTDSDYNYGYGRQPADDEPWNYNEPWMVPGPFSGLGPRGYERSDENIYDDVCERLTNHGFVDASDIELSVDKGIVTLQGSIDSRQQKRLAEAAVDTVPGVFDVNNRLVIRRRRPASPELGPGQGRADIEHVEPPEEKERDTR